MSGTLPNLFDSGERDVQGVRNEIRAAAHEAGLIGELVRPLDNPISRAKWSFPYHAAALSRRYRVSTHPAERKDGLLKLGEGLARVLGVLALTELAAWNGFSRNLRELFLLNEARDDQLTLRSLEEHSLEMTYGPPE
ncbi:hypothetical protein EES43_22750 [Streptomyces sp. ADI96-02]|nr:hypothetical protein EES43_22750 [Streptomyces sp. ADI96-02]